jgi:hypothetical protein
VLSEAEQRFLDTRYADPATKNISLRGAQALMRGAVGRPKTSSSCGPC